MDTTWRDVIADIAETFVYWFRENAIEIFLVAILAGVVFGGYYVVFVAFPQYREEQIQLCMRAFERTHDQCEFIIRNRIPMQ